LGSKQTFATIMPKVGYGPEGLVRPRIPLR
jgi:hypothetical protein